MKTELQCVPCVLDSYLRLAETGIIPESREKELLRSLLDLLYCIDYNQSSPEPGRMMHRLIRESIQDPNPYLQI